MGLKCHAAKSFAAQIIAQSANAIVPILSIKRDPPRNRQSVNAARIDAPPIRMTAGAVKGFDAARAAKQMVRRHRSELIRRQCISAR